MHCYDIEVALLSFSLKTYDFFRNANKKEIIKAYRKLAREWHPDNFQDEKEKKDAEKKFIEIAAAKEVLSDAGIFH